MEISTEEKIIIIGECIRKINNILAYSEENGVKQFHVHGICRFITEGIFIVKGLDIPNQESESCLNAILNDINDATGFTINRRKYYWSFCKIELSKIDTMELLNLWYKKRLKALEKTLEYLKNKL
ncbi:MAG: hypothetical protein LBE56_12300 [Tannerella sp.]|jgi:hypothetical protein|nr:hypothetical protein [Tannerella sp.]